MEDRTRVETVTLPSGSQLQIEVRDEGGGYQDVGAFDALRFDAVTATLEELGQSPRCRHFEDEADQGEY